MRKLREHSGAKNSKRHQCQTLTDLLKVTLGMNTTSQPPHEDTSNFDSDDTFEDEHNQLANNLKENVLPIVTKDNMSTSVLYKLVKASKCTGLQ